MSNLKILPKIPLYQMFRAYGFPKLLPLNLTISVLYSCNSRCKTCNVWKKKADNFTLDEYEKIFRNIGNAPYWFTMSGGEPFMRKDIVEICTLAYKFCQPGIINIPTNGILYNKIPEQVAKIAENCPKTQIIINLSLDAWEEEHNEIRGVKDNFENAIKTWNALKKLSYSNLNLGINTIISTFNIENFNEIYDKLITLEPDSYVTEIAEERVELDTIGANITPPEEDYKKAIDFLKEELKKQKFDGIGKITRGFRLEYYDLVKKWLHTKEQIIPCYAGWASAHISPDGDVWFCCIRADVIGNLRETNYDFKKIWFSPKATEIRKSIKNKECSCPLANASYTNLLHNYSALFRVGWNVLTS